MSEKVNVAIIGVGTVGGGACEVLCKNTDIIAIRSTKINIKAICDLDLVKARAVSDKSGLKDVIITKNWQDIVNDPEVDIVVETIGGTGVAKEIIVSAINNKKSVVSANKDLMARDGGELLALAAQNKVDLFFEASVAGGIPIIQAMKESLAGNDVKQIMGIVNGTTNYILTKMTETGADFNEALADAQRLGYAEADPTNDIEGYDAARKMAILASIAFNVRVRNDMVPVEGITKIDSWDIAYAKEFGYVMKMLGVATSDSDGVEVRVNPVMIPAEHPLASVKDSFNAVYVDSYPLGQAMFYGRGAGSLPTASAVVGDVINATRNITNNSRGRWGCTCALTKRMKTLEESISKYYLRVAVHDRSGVFASLTSALAKHNISLESVMQRRSIGDGEAVIVIVTHKVSHASMLLAAETVRALDTVLRIESLIRVED